MSPKPLFRLGQQLTGKVGVYRITKQVSEHIYFATYVRFLTGLLESILIGSDSDQQEDPVVVKSIERHWRLQNERDILQRFQGRTPSLRPLVDEIGDPGEPAAIILRYLDDDLTRASRKQRLTRQEIKYIANNVLEALRVLHEDGYVHTGM